MTHKLLPLPASSARHLPRPAWASRWKTHPWLKWAAVLLPASHLLTHRGTPSVASTDALTVLTANLWHDWPRHRRGFERLERFVQLVEARQADVLLLQEVWRTRSFCALDWLSERLGWHAVYLRANGHRTAIGFEEGVAVLSRYPLRAADVRQWADGRLARRVALGVHVATPWGEWLAVSAHLSLLARRNRAQMLDLQRWTAQQAGERPAVIGGDFNAPESHAVIRQLGRAWVDLLRQQQPTGEVITHEVRWPWGGRLHAARLDYLFLKPGFPALRLCHAALLDDRHSDHRPLLARLRPAA